MRSNSAFHLFLSLLLLDKNYLFSFLFEYRFSFHWHISFPQIFSPLVFPLILPIFFCVWNWRTHAWTLYLVLYENRPIAWIQRLYRINSSETNFVWLGWQSSKIIKSNNRFWIYFYWRFRFKKWSSCGIGNWRWSTTGWISRYSRTWRQSYRSNLIFDGGMRK